MTGHRLRITTATPPSLDGGDPRCAVHGRCSCGTAFHGTPSLPGDAQQQVDEITRAHREHRSEVYR